MEVQGAQTGASRAGPDEVKVNRMVERENIYAQVHPLDTHTNHPVYGDRSLKPELSQRGRQFAWVTATPSRFLLKLIAYIQAL